MKVNDQIETKSKKDRKVIETNLTPTPFKENNPKTRVENNSPAKPND